MSDSLATTITTNFRGTSTNLNPRYLMSDFVPTVTTVGEDGKTNVMLEIFSPKFSKAIAAIVPMGLQRYVGQPITTLTYRRYRNTTAWWMVMLASKQLHALTIENGTVMVLPDIDNVRKSTTLRFATGARIPVFTSI